MNKTVLFGLTAIILMLSIVGFANMHTADAAINLNSSKSNVYKVIGQLQVELKSNPKALALVNALEVQISKTTDIDGKVKINKILAQLEDELSKSNNYNAQALLKALQDEISKQAAVGSIPFAGGALAKTVKEDSKANQTRERDHPSPQIVFKTVKEDSKANQTNSNTAKTNLNTSRSNIYKIQNLNLVCQTVKNYLTNAGYPVTVVAKVMTDMNCS